MIRDHHEVIEEATRLIHDLEDGVIATADRERLMELMRSDGAIRRRYMEQLQLSALIQQSAETRAELGTMPISSETLQREKRRSVVLSLSYAAAAVVALGLGMLLYQVSQPDPSSTVVLDSSSDASFAIVQGNEDDGGQLGPGDQVTLQRGLLRLRFPSGVEALIEGPSQIELISASTVRMDAGMGWFRVPEEGRGFTVRTELGRIVDLGTEFGIRFARGDQLEVHVQTGRVEVLPSVPGAGKVGLNGGTALSFDSSGRSHPIDLRPSLFRRQFSKAIPRVHWSFDTVVDGAFPASGSFDGVESHALRLRNRQGEVSRPVESQIDGVFGRALSLKAGGLFAESDFPGIDGDAPRTVAVWIRHRTAPSATETDPRTGAGATPPAGDQAYLLNYTNAGLTTATGATGVTLSAGTTYSLEFQAAALPESGTTDYRVELVAFSAADDDTRRLDSRVGSSPGKVVAVAEGVVRATDPAVRGRASFTPASGDPHLGRELGIRLIKPGAPVLYDEIRLATHRRAEPPVFVFSEDFEVPQVSGYAEQTLPYRGWIGARPHGQSPIESGFGAEHHGLFSDRPVGATPVVAWGTPGSASAWAGFMLPGRPPVWTVMNARGYHDARGPEPLLPDVWTHVATVCTGRRSEDGRPEILHYIDGRLAETVSHFPAPLASSAADSTGLRIGRLPGSAPGGPTLDADIDELHILRAALGEEEIWRLMDENRPVVAGE
ncbi:LamG-like jellyroll fold domain-containing protein [Haloferula sp. A504]|uniref:LamG-like jellyroll fold domain-containing protein n=1 Tax=Haloferula sp. A504 TaxID=3373601 RepID=UPI0031BDC0D9|nr:FecR domain-containing protein [Verrucomicrobiaceae bacterium E54]